MSDRRQADPSSTVCRVSAGVCDTAESCDGTTNNCPTDAFLPSRHGMFARRRASVIRPRAVPGSAAACPTDGPSCRRTRCVASQRGSATRRKAVATRSDACPGDGFVAGGTECAAATGVCDVPEVCTGSSAACPADGPNLTTQCRASAGICDVAEFCSDASDACPGDGFVAAGTECRGGGRGVRCAPRSARGVVRRVRRTDRT